MKKGLFLFVLLLTSLLSFAQDHFSSNPDEFAGQVQDMMNGSKNEKLIAIGDQLGLVFDGLTSEQQKKIIDLSNSLKANRQKTPVFGYYFGGIVAATNSSEVNSKHLTQFLDVCSGVFENEGGSAFASFIKDASRFMINLELFDGNLYNYQLEGGRFSFEYVQESEPESIVDQYEEAADEEKKEEEDPFGTWDTEETDDGWGDTGDETDWSDPSSWGTEPTETTPTNEKKEAETAEKINFGAPEIQLAPVKGAVIKIENANILVTTPYDSNIVIENVTGQYMLSKNHFVGTEGKFSWASAGHYDMDDVYADLGKFEFKTSGALMIKAEAAQLHYPSASDEVVEGIFQYKSERRRSEAEAPSYPRFMSYKSSIPLKNIGEDIQYLGGLSLDGAVQSSASVYGERSEIIVSMDGVEKFRAKSVNFQIDDTSIFSKKAFLILLANDDSIMHEGMYLQYGMESKVLHFFRGPKSSDPAPFVDTEHNVEIKAEELKWNLNEKDIHFSMVYAANLKSASVESRDFYTDGRFTKLQGISHFHPLTVVTYYANKNNTDEVYASDLAKSINQKPQVVKAAMANLAHEGFISYSPGTGKIVLKRKAKLYAAARRKKADWDQLLIYSRANSRNMTYDLDNDDLTIRGVEEVMLSVQQSIRVVPDSGKVIMRGNRDIYFDGTMYSGQFQFTGSDYRFDYDSFFVNMATIDSIRLRINEVDSTGENEDNVHTLGNTLVYSSGVLYIDKQDNKSHKKNYPEYPIFDATTGAYVYFNKPDILDNAYDTTVYFRIPPFVMDSLNESNPNTVSFNGTFYGGDILEPFDEVLRVMPDYSFGFEHDIPEKGYDIYGGRGKLFNDLTLNKQGLRVDGKIEYLTTTLNSPDFILYIDSVTTDTGTVANMAEGELNNVLYPVASLEDYRLDWKIQEDSMYIFNRDSANPISLYQDKASLDGALIVTPKGTYGHGRALSGRAVAVSPEMYFSKDYFEANKADFYVNIEGGIEGVDEPTIRADSVYLHYNMVENYADFGPEEEGRASIEFPFMKYRTSISHGRLDMVENIVTMEKDEDEFIESSYFYSTLEEQDSLAFYAERAVCDLDESTLKVYGVPYIKVADSKIIPDSNKVYIEENANIQSFNNAIVVIDTLSEYHRLDSGQIDIISRHKYTGQANYQYVNALEDTFHIAFNEFITKEYNERRNDDRVYTMANGYVEEDDSLFISPRIQYYGDVELDAREAFLYFNGYVKIDLKGGFLSDWFKFEGRINPADVKIDLEDPKSSDGTPLLTGLHLYAGLDTAALYSTFIALKQSDNDFDIMTTGGVFGYNPYQNEFRISEEAKENAESMSGNVLVLNDSTSGVRYEGEFRFMEDIPRTVEMRSGGSGEGNIMNEEYNFHTLTTVYLKLPSNITREMGDTLYEATRASFETMADPVELAYRISEIAGDKPAEMYTTSTEDFLPLPMVSSKFNRTLVFSNLDLSWSKEHSAFYSNDTVSIANVMKTHINAAIDGFVEIKHTPEGQELQIYLQPDPYTWYYINFANSTATLLSSSLSFNTSVFMKSNLDKRSTPGDYAFGLGDYFSKEKFIRHYKQDYLGLSLEDSLDPIALEQKQSALAAKIQEFISGGGSRARETEEEDDSMFEEDEDIFFEEDLNLDEPANDQEEVPSDDDLDDLNFDNLDEELDMLDENTDDSGSDNLFDTSTEEEKEEPKDRKKDKDKKEEKSEESLLDEELDSLDDFMDDTEDLSPEDPNGIPADEVDDPWADTKKKKKKKKKKGKDKEEEKQPEEEDFLDSLDEELEDLEE